MKKICIARDSGGIGDILMLTPGIGMLSSQGWEVSVAIDRHTTKGDTYYLLLKDNPHIQCIYDYRYVNKDGFDKFVDLSCVAYLYEQAGYSYTRCEIFARKMGVKLKSNKPKLFLTRSWKNTVPTIGLHFKSAEKRRSLPEETSNKLIEYLLKNTNFNLLLLDNSKENRDSGRVKNCYNKDIESSIREFDKCIYFIGVDSGWLHIAGALGIRSLGIFGSTKPYMRIKDYNSSYIWAEIECRGCFYKQCEVDYACMKKITVEEILESLRNENLLL